MLVSASVAHGVADEDAGDDAGEAIDHMEEDVLEKFVLSDDEDEMHVEQIDGDPQQGKAQGGGRKQTGAKNKGAQLKKPGNKKIPVHRAAAVHKSKSKGKAKSARKK